MILMAWRNTDPAFNNSELEFNPPRMVNRIQFEFDPADRQLPLYH